MKNTRHTTCNQSNKMKLYQFSHNVFFCCWFICLFRSQRAKAIATSTILTTTQSASQTERTDDGGFVAPQLIKFELTDAKIPDFIKNAQHQRHQPSKSSQNSRPRQRKSRKGTSTEANQSAEQDASKSIESQEVTGTTTATGQSSDQSGSDTRLLHIAHSRPSSSFESQRYAKSMPFGLQKTIHQAMKSEYNPPYLETVKLYFKEPLTRAKFSPVASLPAGAKLFSDSRIKQWWQLPPQFKASASTYGLGGKLSPTTIKPIVASASPYPNDFVAYPLLRGYPVQYSMNVANDLVNGVSFLYGDRIYAKPYSHTSYQNKYRSQANTIAADIKPVVEPKPSGEVDDDNGIFRTTHATPTSLFSTSPIVFPSSTEMPRKQTYFSYYGADGTIPRNPDTGVPLSNDKNTIQLINKAVHELRKHNPHLQVVPKRIENDELVVHVTPKSDFYSTKFPTTPRPVVSVSESLKDLVTDKNLVYLNKVTELGGRGGGNGKDPKHTVAYVTHIELPSNLDDLVRVL